MYDVGGNRFLLGDCFDRMREIADGSVDMVLADLPYGTTQNKWDSVLPLDALWAEYWRVCRPGAAVVLTAAQPFTSALVMSQPRAFRYSWVWEKDNPSGHLNANRAPLRAHEDILVFCQQGAPYNPQKTSGHPRKTAYRTGGSDNYGDQKPSGYSSTDRYPRSVQQFAGHLKAGNDHPTQKPVALFEYLIRTYTNPDALVLDNTAGSGTTAIAALNTGRRFICIEREPDYYWPAVARVMDAHS
jgi:hypothetical protein